VTVEELSKWLRAFYSWEWDILLSTW